MFKTRFISISYICLDKSVFDRREINHLYRDAHGDALTEIALIHANAEEERKNEMYSLESIRLIGEEARKTMLKMIEVIFGHVIYSFCYILIEQDGRRQMLMAIIALSITVFTVIMSKELINVIFNVMIRSIAKPRLVREWGYTPLNFRSNTKTNLLSEIVLPQEEKERINKLYDSISFRDRRRRAPLRNLLIYGQAGTGKSMIARGIAEGAYGMPFAIMSGADVAPLENLGPCELGSVLSWANSQRNGGIIIIDEAESALGKRVRQQKQSTDDNKHKKALATARDALNVFLTLTGDTSGKAMIILTTSSPDSLDEAVLDRCDEMIHCRLPNENERKDILTQELVKRFFKVTTKDTTQFRSFLPYLQNRQPRSLQIEKSFNVHHAIERISKDDMTFGFSGRELSKMIRAVESTVYSSDKNLLTNDIWNQVVNTTCVSIKNKKKLKATREELLK
jgi:ATPase family AAA domain-containing protein 3A/B